MVENRLFNSDELQQNFQNDIKEFVLEKLDKNYLKKEFDIDWPILAVCNAKQYPWDKLLSIYLHFKKKFPMGKYRVCISDKMRRGSLYQKFMDQVNEIKNIFENGESIRPYLSKKINNVEFKDKLLEDWGILHIHLFTTDKRDNNLLDSYILFIKIIGRNILFINIYEHKFHKIEALQIISDHFNDEFHTLNGVNPDKLTEQEMVNYRKLGVGYTFAVAEKCFAAGMDSMKNEIFITDFNVHLENLARCLCIGYDELMACMMRVLGDNMLEPLLHIAIDDKNKEVFLYDKANSSRLLLESEILINMGNMLKNVNIF